RNRTAIAYCIGALRPCGRVKKGRQKEGNARFGGDARERPVSRSGNIFDDTKELSFRICWK
ncbi:MAG: hypothetical protein U9N41_03720, partial [Euryarchaeota archaeon]|nr:hypothetical protein [Euryarchaeota archaeon]